MGACTYKDDRDDCKRKHCLYHLQRKYIGGEAGRDLQKVLYSHLPVLTFHLTALEQHVLQICSLASASNSKVGQVRVPKSVNITSCGRPTIRYVPHRAPS